jgi:hypothetical protein
MSRKVFTRWRFGLVSEPNTALSSWHSPKTPKAAKPRRGSRLPWPKRQQAAAFQTGTFQTGTFPLRNSDATVQEPVSGLFIALDLKPMPEL